MKVNINKDQCIGCGACAAISPDVFEIEDDGLACASGNITEENKNDVIEAIESCPTGAIKSEQ